MRGKDSPVLKGMSEINRVENSLKDILDEYEGFISKLKENNIKLLESMRFMKFYKDILVLSKSTDGIGMDEIYNSDSFIEGFRDYYELREILKSDTIFKTSVNDLNKIFGGNRLSLEDKDTTARNYQYQLYIGSFFEKRGVPVLYQEPDLEILFNNQRIGMAVKRVSSIDKITSRIREAEKQIEKSGIDGIIVISLDNIINREEFSISKEDWEQLYNITESKLENFLKENYHHDWYYNRIEGVKGVLFTLTTPSRISGQLTFGSTFAAIGVPLDSEDDYNWKLLHGLLDNVFHK
jgi:hypothetical protein